MSAAEFGRSIDFLVDEVFPEIRRRAGRSFDSIGVSYVGGELLVSSQKELAEGVFYARDRLLDSFDDVHDDAISNLIGSSARVSRLVTLFQGRVHTSVDSFGDRRRVGGSADSYRRIFLRNYESVAARRRINLATIFLLDAVGVGRLIDEYREAQVRRASFGLKFASGAGKGAEAAPASTLAAALCQLFDLWAMAPDAVPVNPLNMVVGRVLERAMTGCVATDCPTSSKCAETTLCIEPDGGLFLCQDMADNGALPLGNALGRQFDWGQWETLRRRGSVRPAQCQGCESYSLCEGGCMSMSLEEGRGLDGVSSHCAVWKALFERADALVRRHGVSAVRSWHRGITEGYVSLA